MKSIWFFVLFAIVSDGYCRITDHKFYFPRLLGATETPTSKEHKPERVVCVTEQCHELAKSLIEGMNRSMDPCNDFYEYACGNWAKYNPRPADESRWNLLAKSQKKVEDTLETMVQQSPNPEDVHATKTARRAFKACMDTAVLEKFGLEPLVSTIWRIGGWPMIMEDREWDENIYKWQNVDDYYAMLIGKNSFHDLDVEVNFWSNEKIDLRITTPNILSSMYKIMNPEEFEVDIDIDEDSEEGSQERGSEQRGESDERDDEDSCDEEEKNGCKLQVKERARARINNAKLLYRRVSNRISRSRKNAVKTITEKRMKRSGIKVQNQKKERKPFNSKINRIKNEKLKLKASKSVRRFEHLQMSTKTKNSRNNEKSKDVDNDMYFDDESNINNSTNDHSEDENNSVDENDEDDGNNDNEYDYVYSGSGDWDDEDGSGSGDYDGDDEDGSGYPEDDDDDTENEDSNEKKWKEVEKIRAKYAEYILNVSIALSEARGVTVSKERLAEDIVNLIQFQLKIMENIFMYADEKNMTLEYLQKKYNALKPTTNNGKINWVQKVTNLLGSGGMELEDDTCLLVSPFGYIKALRKLLDKTPSRTIVNYIHWNFISRVLKATTKKMSYLYYDWDDTSIEEKQRTEYCVEEIQAKYILGYEYVKRYFPEQILQTASDMVDDIQKEVEYEIKESPWMDSEMRHVILDKLVYMKRMIGYSDSYKNETAIKEYFKGFSATKSHFENTLNIMRYMVWTKLKMFFTKELFYEADLNPLIVNAFFSPYENIIEITAADFQRPFYDVNQPWYTNYGIIGLIMSHEVNHGFDVNGRWFDKAGELAEWPLEMQEEYDKRAQCFMDQFTRYSVVMNKTANIPIEHYGEQTAGENIADTMGMNAAFKAYKRRLRVCNTTDPMLPGLEDLSNEQLFFLSFAHVWCEDVDPVKLPELLKRDSHSSGPLRVIGSVSNSEEFAKAYKCPTDSPMNPEEKCSIWK